MLCILASMVAETEKKTASGGRARRFFCAKPVHALERWLHRGGDAFDAGLRRGLTSPALTAELFAVRARVLLGDLPAADAASFTSGLLIGIDLSVGLTLAADCTIIIMGRPELTSLYAAGATAAGRPATEIDGATAFVAGAVAIAKTIS